MKAPLNEVGFNELGFTNEVEAAEALNTLIRDYNERNEKPTHTDRRGRHDKMMCWGDKSCPGCECMCHVSPTDQTE